MPLLPSTIQRDIDRNTPGACMLQFARVEDVDEFPDEVYGVVEDEITLVEGAEWITVHGVVFTQEFTEEWQLRDGDQLAVAGLGFEISKDRPALLAGLYRLKPGRYVVLHHDLNKQVKVLGTKDEPAQLRIQQLQHGRGPGTRNSYEGLVNLARRTACPFYQATPPTPVPAVCPTVVQQLAELNATQIATYLAELGLTEAVQAQICQTLCAMLDAAFVPDAGDGSLNVVIDAGEATVPIAGTTNGKPYYADPDWAGLGDWLEIWWQDGEWHLTYGFDEWTSAEDVATPDLVTTWSGPATLPVVDATGTGYDVSAITDCLSVEQAAALLAALGGAGSGGTVLIRNAADDETLATVTAPDSYVLPAIRIPYVDAAGDPQYFLVYVDSIASGELTVTEPGGGAPPVPRFTVYATNGITAVGHRDLVSPALTLPQSVIKYKDAANASQVTAASNTEFASTTLRPADEVPRREIKNRGGTGMGVYASVDALIADTLPNAPIPLKFAWAAGDADTYTWTVTTDEAGTYTTYTDDGGSGTVTYSKNGAGFAALSGTVVLAVSDTIVIRRTTSTSNGWCKWA